MGIVGTIAARDFKSYAFSMRGAAVFFFCLIIMGAFFQSFVYTFVDLQEQGPMMGGEGPGLHQLVQALCQNLHFVILLLVPAITMASFAEDKKSKSYKLLLASPVKPRQVVLGKYFGCLCLVSLVLASTGIFFQYIYQYGNPDPLRILTSFLGLGLLVSAQVAFGIWVSSMTSHQFLAFIFTMAGLFFMLILNWIAPHISSTEEVEGFVRYLAVSTHLEPFFKGLVSVSNIGFFLLFTFLFLFLTTSVVDSERWR